MWKIDFTDPTEGLYTLKEIDDTKYKELIKQDSPLSPNIMFSTHPDLESYATIIEATNHCEYFPVTLDLIKKQIISVDALNFTKHWVMVGKMWEVHVLLKKIHPACFELGFNNGEHLFVSEFALGEPDI